MHYNQLCKKYSKNTNIHSQEYVLNNLQMIKEPMRKPSIYYPYGKRLFDLFLSISGILFTLPIMILVVIAIKLDSPGPAFYRQERVGLWGKPFQLLKFRSMLKDADKIGPQYTQKNDARITRVGAFIRTRRLDELPQLINVLTGDMSMVGPRPIPIIDTISNKEIAGYFDRLIVKPGLTGLAQVNGGYDLSFEEKLQYDLFYIQHISFLLDIKILLKTMKVILTGEGAR
ncbi:sugar transferase [Thermoflavimicrobium dichotomicum]|uniref:Sugar transferase involved in LPS biosynthesis (Colanic, teichoic acid) n=1 Tax=Thermoflavimicrobium dichotomicum TaxID=46223 RepID=A0A1I3NAH1_9BACL|nr:sugar transferase [Thermoflavimicrobium dichotomicum]SFJ06323.1 Sugar transferase involved in LPS biosynthesis (colanic, teichoic acid) [Thermoflavimicrobium dichotomicum]